jgi:anti-anti-sigma regulatory factor
MTDASEIVLNKTNGNLTIKVKGFISELSDLFKQDLSGYKVVILDFEETTFINSLGIRLWVDWFKSTRIPATTTVKLINCVPSLVSQFNMVKGFISSNCIIESLYANYYVEESDEEKRVLLTRSKDFEPEKDGHEGWVKIKEEITTPKGEEMVLDTIKEKYFSFLGKVKFI